MKLQLDKWYLDLATDNHLAFHYVMRLRIGPITIGASEFHHFHPEGSAESFRIARVRREDGGGLQVGRASLILGADRLALVMRHGRCAIRGVWTPIGVHGNLSPAVVYRTRLGWCDWRIVSPRAAVDAKVWLPSGTVTLRGSGYVDAVRFAFPFREIPFYRLYWARLHSGSDWIVLFHAETRSGRLSLYTDGACVSRRASVRTNRGPGGRAKSFEWVVADRDCRRTVCVETVRILEQHSLLDRGLLGKLFPDSLLRAVSSSGVEAKYEAMAVINRQEYHGIAEEVVWHGV